MQTPSGKKINGLPFATGSDPLSVDPAIPRGLKKEVLDPAAKNNRREIIRFVLGGVVTPKELCLGGQIAEKKEDEKSGLKKEWSNIFSG